MRSIVIKKVDKGSNIVILNREYYIKHAMRKLKNDKFYIECEEDLTTRINSSDVL